MLRPVLTVAVALTIASLARAHFLFVVPESDGQHARVMLSEDLQTDTDIDGRIVSGAKLSIKSVATGKEKDLTLTKGEHECSTELPGSGLRVVHGTADLGVRGEGPKPYLLNYYAKTIVGDAFDGRTQLHDAPVELAAVGSAGRLQFELLVDGKPAANQEINLIKPGNEREKVSTDANGLTPVLIESGRYGAWARHIVPDSAGERDGKHFNETRQYATIVIDALPKASADGFAPMIENASSFGAAAVDGYAYVYGGHIVDTHNYSLKSVSGQFSRMNLAHPDAWEPLPGGPHLQGMNLAAWRGKIVRVGGMSPQNQDGEEANVRSVADVALFDPQNKTWSAIKPLPQPRSSHDVAVIGDTLYVLGGWDLTGDPDEAKWPDHMLSLDLSKPDATWQELPQPFQRRALIAAVHDGKVWAIGGFRVESEPSLEVNIFDPTTGEWSAGPALPGPTINGFGPAACEVSGKLTVSVGDGTILQLRDDHGGWDKVAISSPRIVHRAIATGDRMVILGGAKQQKQTNLIESLKLVVGADRAAR